MGTQMYSGLLELKFQVHKRSGNLRAVVRDKHSTTIYIPADENSVQGKRRRYLCREGRTVHEDTHKNTRTVLVSVLGDILTLGTTREISFEWCLKHGSTDWQWQATIKMGDITSKAIIDDETVIDIVNPCKGMRVVCNCEVTEMIHRSLDGKFRIYACKIVDIVNCRVNRKHGLIQEIEAMEEAA